LKVKNGGIIVKEECRFRSGSSPKLRKTKEKAIAAKKRPLGSCPLMRLAGRKTKGNHGGENYRILKAGKNWVERSGLNGATWEEGVVGVRCFKTRRVMGQKSRE